MIKTLAHLGKDIELNRGHINSDPCRNSWLLTTCALFSGNPLSGSCFLPLLLSTRGSVAARTVRLIRQKQQGKKQEPLKGFPENRAQLLAATNTTRIGS